MVKKYPDLSLELRITGPFNKVMTLKAANPSGGAKGSSHRRDLEDADGHAVRRRGKS